MSFEREIAERLVHSRMKSRIRESQESVPRSYYKKVEYILNHRLGSYETGVSINNIDIISETPETITLKIDYEVNIQIPMIDPEDKSTYYEQDSEYRTQTMTFDFDELDERLYCEDDLGEGLNLGDEVNYRGKSYTIIKQRGDSRVLRPSSKVDDRSFDGEGDSFDDIHLDKYQLSKCMRED